MRRLLLSILCVSLSLSAIIAQEKTPQVASPKASDPNAWSVRTYRFPLEQLSKALRTKEQGQLHTPAMPTIDASERELVAFLKESTRVVGTILSEKGLVLPQGTLLAYDRTNKTLAVRTNTTTHELIAPLADLLCQTIGYDSIFNLCIMEADADVVRTAVKDAATQADHSFILARLETLADQGQAKRLKTMQLVAGGREHVRKASADKPANSKSMTSEEKMNAELLQKIAKVGTVLDLDSDISIDNNWLDISYSLTHHYAVPTIRKESVKLSDSRRIESRVIDLHTVKLNSGITMSVDSTVLLGVWATETLPGAASPRTLQAAFLKGGIALKLPTVSYRVEELLKTYGERTDPTPTESTVIPDQLPPGMTLRHYRVPPDFLKTCGPSKVSPDDVLALKILQQIGILFPEGAFVKFHSVTATPELIVCNTPENHEAVQSFVDSILNKPPRFIAHTLQIIQADAAFLRKLESETKGMEDHTAVWQRVESEVALGRAKILSMVWAESRSGQRANVSAGYEQILLSGSPKTSTDAKAINRVGTVFDVDASIGPDGETVFLDITLNYDYSPPTLRQKPESDVGKTASSDTLVAGFHKTILTSNMTLKDGATRLVGVWNPETLADGQNKDVLQAAFIRVDVLHLENKEEK